jgi:HAD superfamily hydrolase (TIGR01459 family)
MQKNIYDKIHSVYEISKKYDLVLFDIWGVLIHELGKHPNQEITNIVNQIILEREVYFVTNAPRTKEYVKNLVSNINIHQDKIITSGTMSIGMLQKSKKYFGIQNPNVYLLGLDSHKPIVKESGVNEVFEVENADLMILAIHSENEIVEDYNKIFEICIKRNMPVMVANPDKILSSSGRITYLAGSYAEVYKSLGGNNLIYSGKPYPDIFNYAIKEASMDVKNHKILMIGDTIDMDILGARNVGIDSGLTVKTGNANYMSLKHEAESYIEQCEAMCKTHEILPTYFVEF